MNYLGWTISKFTIGERGYVQATKDGTTVAIRGSVEKLIELLDSLDFSSQARYNN